MEFEGAWQALGELLPWCCLTMLTSAPALAALSHMQLRSRCCRPRSDSEAGVSEHRAAWLLPESGCLLQNPPCNGKQPLSLASLEACPVSSLVLDLCAFPRSDRGASDTGWNAADLPERARRRHSWRSAAASRTGSLTEWGAGLHPLWCSVSKGVIATCPWYGGFGTGLVSHSHRLCGAAHQSCSD